MFHHRVANRGDDAVPGLHRESNVRRERVRGRTHRVIDGAEDAEARRGCGRGRLGATRGRDVTEISDDLLRDTFDFLVGQ